MFSTFSTLSSKRPLPSPAKKPKRVRKPLLEVLDVEWFDLWINEYLLALCSDDEGLRDSVCTLITPIVIKINKNSLPLILSTVRTPALLMYYDY
jgi:hypothetical protein